MIDIPKRQLVIYRQPTASGYAQIAAYGAEDMAATFARPNDPVRVADLSPPVAE